MTKIVNQLLRLKSYRATEAANLVHTQRLRLEEAARLLQRHREALERYHGWRLAREDALFDDICRRLVKVDDVEDVKQAIFQMREKERLLQDTVKKAEAARDEAAAALEQARVAHRLAERVVQKYRELYAILIDEERIEAARVESVELEEFKPRPFAPSEEAAGSDREEDGWDADDSFGAYDFVTAGSARREAGAGADC